MFSKKKLASLSAGAVLAAVLVMTQTAASHDEQKHYRLGGAWVGHRVDNAVDKFRWAGVFSPADPAGTTASIRLSCAEWSPGWDQAIAMHGGDTVTDAIGSVKMINNRQAKVTMLAYEQTAFPVKIVAIEVYSGTLTFTGPDSMEVEYSATVYPASADADGDGCPDPGAAPYPGFTITGIKDIAYRVPVVK